MLSFFKDSPRSIRKTFSKHDWLGYFFSTYAINFISLSPQQNHESILTKNKTTAQNIYSKQLYKHLLQLVDFWSVCLCLWLNILSLSSDSKYLQNFIHCHIKSCAARKLVCLNIQSCFPFHASTNRFFLQHNYINVYISQHYTQQINKQDFYFCRFPG